MTTPDTLPAGKPLALVTGASSGIGLELAKQFAQHGFDLVVAAENPEITQAASELSSLGADVTPVQADLSTYEGVEELYDRTRQLGRPVEALALNAGVGSGGPFSETDLRKELEVIAVNVTSTVHLAKRVIPEMVDRGRGKVLITSSIASTQPGPYEAVYAATKAFDQSFAESIRTELKDTGVTVTSLMPGVTQTNFFKRADMTDTRAGGNEKLQDDPAKVAEQGFKALMDGEEKVVAGNPLNKVMAATGRVTPDALKAKMHTALSEPGSNQQPSNQQPSNQ
jgi:short-subunit dehydrogenase